MKRGTHAFVTGAGRGIGAAIAQTLAEVGYGLTLVGRTREDLQHVLSVLPGGPHHKVICDLTDPESVHNAFVSAKNALGPVDTLINNAGQVQTASIAKTPLDMWQAMLAVNLTGTFLCCQEALQDMHTLGQGRIINIASTAALKGYAYSGAYCASKHGVLGLTRALALEVAKQGISVNAVCPGYTDTEIVREGVGNIVTRTGRTPEAALAELVRANPQGRLVSPEEVAQTVLWLCESAASSITGQAIAVCGGEVMN